MNPNPPMLHRRSLVQLLALVPLGACAELRTPNTPWPVPPGLLPVGADPGRAAITVLAQGMQGANTGIHGDPVRVARLAALLEWMAVELMASPRWGAVPADARAGIGLARDEMRGALGADPLAASPRLAAALAAAYRALLAGDNGAAAAALPASLFPRGGEAVLARLSEPGPLPQGEISTAALAQRVQQLDETNGWAVDFDTPVPADRGGRGSIPFGI